MMTATERMRQACLNQEVDRPPLWMMRQAGRYLPEYRVVKEKYPTKQMMQTPEIAADITMQPISILDVDAAILYSDILMIPDALGMGLDFKVGEGPQFEFPIQSEDQMNQLNTQNVMDRLSYVFETVTLCCKRLGPDRPLLGFAGAPFTVACYMISGGKLNDDFSTVKNFAWSNPKLFSTLMTLLTDLTIEYLFKQADAGVLAVQLFDTWAGVLSPEDYKVLCRPYSQRIFEELKKQYIPSIHYIKGGSYLLDQMALMPSDVIAVDWRVDLRTIRARTNYSYAIQGNLDPDLLRAPSDVLQKRAKEMLDQIEDPKKGYIVNLGHGISQYTPVKNAIEFVNIVKKHFR